MNKTLLLTLIAAALSAGATNIHPSQPFASPFAGENTYPFAGAKKCHKAPTREGGLSEGADTDIRQVEGRREFVTVTGWGFVDTDKGVKPAAFDMSSDIVYGDDGFVYLHAPLGGTRSSYVKGVLAADGKSFTVQYPQIINTVSAEDRNGTMQRYPVYAQVMESFLEEDEFGSYYT